MFSFDKQINFVIKNRTSAIIIYDLQICVLLHYWIYPRQDILLLNFYNSFRVFISIKRWIGIYNENKTGWIEKSFSAKSLTSIVYVVSFQYCLSVCCVFRSLFSGDCEHDIESMCVSIYNCPLSLQTNLVHSLCACRVKFVIDKQDIADDYYLYVYSWVVLSLKVFFMRRMSNN